MTHPDLLLEQQYLNTVLDVIRRRLRKLSGMAAADRDGIIQARRDMWENTAHIIHSFDDIVDLSASEQSIQKSTSAYLVTVEEIRKLQRMQPSPYFGRFDFIEEGGSAPLRIYIGIANLMDEDSYDIYVYDWRAPVCSVFYEYEPTDTLTDASYETPEGRKRIRVTLKRQFKIENGTIVYLYDTDSAMHDDILGRVLSQNTSGRLKIIISSIQKEQNAAIRNPDNRQMLIYGLAGSGKTSVGLHRLAYLLYRRRDTLRPGDVVILSSNGVFNSYIASVLPQLGEHDVNRLLFHSFLDKALKNDYAFENHIRQHQALTADSGGGDRLGDIRVKYSFDFLSFCEAYFTSFRWVVPELRYKDRVIVSKEAFQSKWDQLRFSGFDAHLENITETIRQYYEDYFRINRKAILEEIAREYDRELTESAVHYRYEARLARCIENAVAQVHALNSVDPQSQLLKVMALYAESHGLPESFIGRAAAAFEEKHLPYEDALLYLLVCVLMGHVSPHPNVVQVLIDEAQDYCPMQLYIIKKLYPGSCFTLLADVNQAVGDVTTMSRYEDFDRIFGDDLVKFRLDRSYRSSGPISALAFSLLGRQAADGFSYFDRAGKKPRYIVTQDPAAAIFSLMPGLEAYNTIGIVTSTQEEADALYDRLRVSLPVQLISDPDDELASPVVLLPLLLSKGLEFDAVFLVGGFQDSGNAISDRRRAYLGCTRALHELYILDTAPLPGCYADCRLYLDTAGA